MSKPLPTQITFANQSPPWSLPNLDSNLAALFAAINDYGTYSLALVDTGSVNALLVTAGVGLTLTLTTGLTLLVTAANTTTSTTPTLNANGTGAKTITDALNNPIQVGGIQSGGKYWFVYDGTNWRMTSTGFLQRAVVKPADTSRSNTATLAIDPDLQLTLTAGIYRYEMFTNFTCTTGGANPGLAVTPAYSGTFSGGAGYALFTGSPSETSSSNFGVTAAPPGSTASQTLHPGPNANGNLVIGSIVASTSGILSVYWSQVTSNATAVVCKAGSYLTVTQM